MRIMINRSQPFAEHIQHRWPATWSLLKLAALRGLIEKDLVDFEYPTYQVLSLPEATER